MRFLIVAVISLFMISLGLGCGGASIPAPSSNATPGPPPGTSPEMVKDSKETKKR